jgi:selenocysteine lyase/cysteine desulfurase
MSPIGATPLLDASHFLNLGDEAYLYWGAHSPALKRVEEAIVESYRAKSLGEGGRDVLYEAESRAHQSLARLTGRSADEVGMLGDASTAWSAIANGWSWKPGDNVVINEYEHPAVFAPFLRLRKYGLEVRVVQRQEDWEMPAASIARACDERTVAIAISHVGYVSGLRHDLNEIGAFAEQAGIPFLVDVSHSLGVTDVDVEYAALTVTASYKWTLGPYGVGAVIWNRDRLPDFEPGTVGWRSLENMFTDQRFDEINWNPGGTRFQMGAPALADIAGLGAGMETILELGVERVAAHSATLASAAIDGLTARGLDVITPTDPARRAGNVAFLHPAGERFARALADEGVLVWGGDGRVRASFHVLNTLDDVERLLTGIDSVLAALPLERISA